ncbi:MAG: L,D-transpeptidase family protein [Rickettsiales bacterium]|nr:L,D-transpeptidase family protein [Rickettsiales bacterium]
MKKIFLILLSILAISSCDLIYKSKKINAKKAENKITLIEVYKSKRKMHMLNSEGKKIRTYNISLGFTPIGKKQFEGDGKTPEGSYFISNRNPNSKYHLSLQVSYPNKDDIEFARQFNKSAGGDIMIHGLKNNHSFFDYIDHLFKDWTAGCIAVTNSEIREIWRLVDVGTPINIYP